MAESFFDTHTNPRITNFLTSDVVPWDYKLPPRAVNGLFFSRCVGPRANLSILPAHRIGRAYEADRKPVADVTGLLSTR